MTRLGSSLTAWPTEWVRFIIIMARGEGIHPLFDKYEYSYKLLLCHVELSHKYAHVMVGDSHVTESYSSH